MHADNRPHSSAEVRDLIAEALGVTDDERKVMLPSGGQPLYLNRVAWAVTYLAQAALLERPARGITQITDRGEQVLRDHPYRVDVGVLSGFPEFVEFRHRSRERKGKPSGELPGTGPAASGLSPREAITDLIDDSHSAVAVAAPRASRSAASPARATASHASGPATWLPGKTAAGDVRRK